MNKAFELSKEVAVKLLPLLILSSLVVMVNTKPNSGATLKSLDYAHAVNKRGELFRSHFLSRYNFPHLKALQALTTPLEQVKSLSIKVPSIDRDMRAVLQNKEQLSELSNTVEHAHSPFLKLRFYRM